VSEHSAEEVTFDELWSKIGGPDKALHEKEFVAFLPSPRRNRSNLLQVHTRGSKGDVDQVNFAHLGDMVQLLHVPIAYFSTGLHCPAGRPRRIGRTFTSYWVSVSLIPQHFLLILVHIDQDHGLHSHRPQCT
jgi:hypothetical protein